MRREMNKVWREVYEKNYLKSLDHRSFYFKQIDKRNLSSKGFVSEARALVEAGTPAVVLFPCADLSLHKDVFDLIMMIAESDSRRVTLHRPVSTLANALPLPRHYNEEGIVRLTRFFRSFVLPSMGLAPEEIATIVPPETPNFVSDRTTYAFNDAAAMPDKEQGLSPMEISLSPSQLAAVPLTENELSAKPHSLLCVIHLHVTPSSPGSHLRSYCNANLFVLFRLYGILYDRLKNARKLESPSMLQVLLSLSHFFKLHTHPASLCSASITFPNTVPSPGSPLSHTAVTARAHILGCSVC